MKRILLFLSFIITNHHQLFAQCGSIINTFPYNEGFESGMGNWSSGGTANDWAWGTPSKFAITSAGGGSKCWVTGGLVGSFYNFGERSFVTSPCFDFTNIANPYVSFKIFWECENTFDGAVFQYSLNNGTTWNNVGTNADPIDCMNINWFNQNNISGLSTLATPKNGWAGNSQPTTGSCQGGGGSLGWVTAKHCMPYLAGQSSVQFRFAFGAGTLCNGFDGFAFDDVLIDEAPSNAPNFTYACTNNSLEYQFTNTSSLCPNNFVWDFGDPASGLSNLSNLQNPLHQFSAPGTYNVTLTVSGPCNPSATIIKTIVTINESVSHTNVLCANSANGSISALATNGTGNLNYTLSPGGIINTTGSFTGLNQGIYTVSVSDAIGCSITSTVSISAPIPLTWNQVSITNVTCNGSHNGQAHVNAIGGTGSIIYTLNPGSISNSFGNFTSLNPINYSVLATDANGCSISTNITITEPAVLQVANFSSTNIICHGSQNGTITTSFSGGTLPYQFTLNPTGTINATGFFNGLGAGSYTVVCTDANGCVKSSAAQITEPNALQIDAVNIKQPGCNPNNDGEVTILASGGTAPLNYSLGGGFGSNNTFSSLTSNNYTVAVKDANGCTVSSLITLLSGNAPSFNNIVVNDLPCANDNVGSITVSAGGSSPIQYSLQPVNLNSVTGVFTNLGVGLYTITITDANTCTNTTTATISSPNPLVISALNYVSEACGSNSKGTLTCTVTGGTDPKEYTLLPNAINNSGVFPNVDAGAYVIKVTDANGCGTTTQTTIAEKICCENVFVPNAFSPNEDNINDEFKLVNASGIALKDFLIFNRWGEVVFSGQSIYDAWNGNFKGVQAEIGTYYYQIRYTCLSTQKDYILKGDLILVR